MEKITAQEIKNGHGKLVVDHHPVTSLMITGGKLMLQPVEPPSAERKPKNLDAARPKRQPAQGIVFASETDAFLARHAERERVLRRMANLLLKPDA